MAGSMSLDNLRSKYKKSKSKKSSKKAGKTIYRKQKKKVEKKKSSPVLKRKMSIPQESEPYQKVDEGSGKAELAPMKKKVKKKGRTIIRQGGAKDYKKMSAGQTRHMRTDYEKDAPAEMNYQMEKKRLKKELDLGKMLKGM